METALKTVLVMLSVVVITLVVPLRAASAADGTAPDDFPVGARTGEAHQLAQTSGDDWSSAATFQAAAVGDCGDGSASDPLEGGLIDIGLSSAFADCDGRLSTAVLTHDGWSDDELDSFIVMLDTDRDTATGCAGYDFSISVVRSGDSFPGFIFREDPSCGAGVRVGSAVGVRADDPRFMGVLWDWAAIGSPASLAFKTATRSVHDETFDFAPDRGAPLPVLDVGSRPQAQARATDDSCPEGTIVDAGFTDVPIDSVHRAAIDCVVQWGIAEGVSPERYGPGGDVTRAQMASFIARLIERAGGVLDDAPPDAFADDAGNIHELDINKLAAAGIVTGRTSDSYAPSASVSRAQMATFIARAIADLTGAPLAEPSGDYFGDDDGSLHEPNINRLAAAGIATGISYGSYGPSSPVRNAIRWRPSWPGHSISSSRRRVRRCRSPDGAPGGARRAVLARREGEREASRAPDADGGRLPLDRSVEGQVGQPPGEDAAAPPAARRGRGRRRGSSGCRTRTSSAEYAEISRVMSKRVGIGPHIGVEVGGGQAGGDERARAGRGRRGTRCPPTAIRAVPRTAPR